MHRFVPVALLAAGMASLSARAPWSWVGMLSATAGLAAWFFVQSSRITEESDVRRTHRDLESRVEEVEARDAIYERMLGVLATGVVALRQETPIYANAAATEILGPRIVGESGPMPAPVREVIDQAAQGVSAQRRFELGFPARLFEARAIPPGPDDLCVVLIRDITEITHADEVRRDFVSAASHELKTPVAAIQAAAETVLMALEDDPDAVRDFSGRIYDNASRLSRIVGDLLDLSRLESSELEMETFDVSDVIREEIQRFGDSHPSISYSGLSTPITGHRADLGLAVRNLLDNAVRYTAPDGWVQVSLQADEGRVSITVADNGPGIPTAALDRVFERFYRVDEARSRETGGTGLGLAIVKHVAEMHGGSVAAESELGVGSSFHLVMPIGADDKFGSDPA